MKIDHIFDLERIHADLQNGNICIELSGSIEGKMLLVEKLNDIFMDRSSIKISFEDQEIKKVVKEKVTTITKIEIN